MRTYSISHNIEIMKTAILTTLFASTAAFAPAQSSVREVTALSASFESELGAQEPLGFWDPLGFCDGADQASFDRLRLVELKHGRIAMLAVVGHIATTAGLRMPGNENIPAGLAAFEKLDLLTVAPNLAVMAVFELLIAKDVKGTGEFPGDFRNGLFKWDASEEEKMEKRAIELNNGRAAQMGILALMVHEKLTGEPYVLNAFLGYPTHFNEGF